MIREITLGQYYKGDSILHKADPRTKILVTIIYIVSLFLAKSVVAYAFATAFLALAIYLSTVPISYMVRGLKAIFMILMFSVIVNMIFIPGRILINFKIFTITYEGLTTAGLMALRLIYLVMGTSLMTLTTTPNRLTDGLEQLLGPLKKIHVPVHEIAMMMSIALRFIPILTEELDKIMKAQMARGASFDEGNLIQKMKSMVPILVPLFVSAVRRANDLAMAMESRCYNGGEGRTKMKPLKYEKRDGSIFLATFVYMAVIIVLRILL